MKTYAGNRNLDPKAWRGNVIVAEVTVDGGKLDPRLDLMGHSPTGFEWGYGGSGPAQLALAILADATGNGDLARSLYQEYKREVVAALPYGGWTITVEQVLQWVSGKRSEFTVSG